MLAQSRLWILLLIQIAWASQLDSSSFDPTSILDPSRPTCPSFLDIVWLSTRNDGIFFYADNDSGHLLKFNIITSQLDILVPYDDLEDMDYEYDYFLVQPAEDYVFFLKKSQQQGEYSSTSSPWFWFIEAPYPSPVISYGENEVQYIEWSPYGETAMLVSKNNIFIWDNGYLGDYMGSTFPLTEDGSPTIYNGFPDPTSAEIFGEGSATLWFSPDANYLVFLRFNVSGHHPIVSIHLLDMTDYLRVEGRIQRSEIQLNTFSKGDLVIGDVVWMTNTHDTILFRTYNRNLNVEKVVLFDVNSGQNHIVQERVVQQVQFSTFFMDNGTYVDISDESGWMHIYLHSLEGDERRRQLTHGEWDVQFILKVDVPRRLVFFSSTEHGKEQPNFYSLHIATGQTKKLVENLQESDSCTLFNRGLSLEHTEYTFSDGSSPLEHINIASILNI